MLQRFFFEERTQVGHVQLGRVLVVALLLLLLPRNLDLGALEQGLVIVVGAHRLEETDTGTVVAVLLDDGAQAGTVVQVYLVGVELLLPLEVADLVLELGVLEETLSLPEAQLADEAHKHVLLRRLAGRIRVTQVTGVATIIIIIRVLIVEVVVRLATTLHGLVQCGGLFDCRVQQVVLVSILGGHHSERMDFGILFQIH